MSDKLVSLHELLTVPADAFVQTLYDVILERRPSFEEEAYHLAKLNRGYSRKQLVLTVFYSPESRLGFAHKQLVGGRAISAFHRIAKRVPVFAKLFVKVIHVFEVVLGIASERAIQFSIEYQLYNQARMQKMRYEISMLQQDVQRRIDLFLMETTQALSSNRRSISEKEMLQRRIEQAAQHLIDSN